MLSFTCCINLLATNNIKTTYSIERKGTVKGTVRALNKINKKRCFVAYYFKMFYLDVSKTNKIFKCLQSLASFASGIPLNVKCLRENVRHAFGLK